MLDAVAGATPSSIASSLGDEGCPGENARKAPLSQADRLKETEADASHLQMALLLSIPKR